MDIYWGSVSNSGTITSGTRSSVTNVKDIFHPVGTNDGNNYHHIHPIAIQADALFSVTHSLVNVGWNFSNGSGASNLGHNTTINCLVMMEFGVIILQEVTLVMWMEIHW